MGVFDVFACGRQVERKVFCAWCVSGFDAQLLEMCGLVQCVVNIDPWAQKPGRALGGRRLDTGTLWGSIPALVAVEPHWGTFLPESWKSGDPSKRGHDPAVQRRAKAGTEEL